MSLVETDSLILKTYNLAEADKIVVLFTRDHGVVRGVAKGAKRLKSRFGSGLEPFSEVRVTYFQKENIELVSLDKTELIRSNFVAAANPEFLQKFSFLSELLISFLPPHDPNEKLYRMAKACVDHAVVEPASLQSLGIYFELWLVKLSGFLPDWRSCQNCRRVLDENETADVQSNLHLMCVNCRRSQSSRQMDGATRGIVETALKLSPERFAQETQGCGRRLSELSDTLRSLISHSLGRDIGHETPITSSQR